MSYRVNVAAQSLRRREVLKLAAGFGAGTRPAALGGTFLQFWAAHLDWDDARWSELFAYLEQLRVRELVIQWSRYDDLDYASLTLSVLERADGLRMSVWVGLAHESRWWQDLDAGPEQMREALRRSAARAAALAGRLQPAVRRHRSFSGWYLPDEVDDVHWNDPGSRQALKAHLRDLHGRLHPLAVSGFSNRALTPPALAAFWREVSTQAADRVLFQDGIGAGKMELGTWPPYLKAIQGALGSRLTVVVETFEHTGAPGRFEAVPAPLDRLRAQCELARRHSSHLPLGFSMPEYMTPLGGPAAARLYEEYVKCCGGARVR